MKGQPPVLYYGMGSPQLSPQPDVGVQEATEAVNDLPSRQTYPLSIPE